MTGKDTAAMLLLAAIWGASFLFMRIAAPEFGIYVLVALRTALASLVLLPVVLARGAFDDVRKYWPAIALVGLINTAIPFSLFNYSSLHLEAGVNAILNATAPMFGALVAWVWLSDRLSVTAIAGLVVGFSGVAIISEQKVSGGQLTIWPIVTALLATTCYGIAASMMKKWLPQVKPVALAGGSQIMASVFLLIPAVLTWPDSNPSDMAWFSAIVLSVGGTGIAYLLYFYLIGSVGPAKAMVVGYLVPLFGIVWAMVFLDETLSLQTMLGGLMILTGVAMATELPKRLLRSPPHITSR